MKRRATPTSLAALALALALAAAAPAAAADRVGEYQVKAAFLKNLTRYVERPGGGATWTICVVGDDPFGPALDAIAGDAGGGISIAVRRVRGGDLGDCAVVFVSASEAARLPSLLGAVKGAPILTVGDTDGFATRGVILNFFLEESRVKFEVNVDAAKRARLTISSRLLGLARVVHDS
jgi:hypothetical protein